MTSEERDYRVMALNLLVLAGEWDAEKKIANFLKDLVRKTEERDARCCRNVAEDWRKCDIELSQVGKDLRKQAAESADLCAHRIAPWTSEKRSVP